MKKITICDACGSYFGAVDTNGNRRCLGCGKRQERSLKHAWKLEIEEHPKRPGKLMLTVYQRDIERGATSCGLFKLKKASSMSFTLEEAEKNGVDCQMCLAHIKKVNEKKQKNNKKVEA